MPLTPTERDALLPKTSAPVPVRHGLRWDGRAHQKRGRNVAAAVFKQYSVRLVHSSRNARKGRYPTIESTSEGVQVARDHRPKLGSWEPGNVSWWLAWPFAIGSMLWVADGYCLVWPPYADASANGVLASRIAIVGGAVFLFGLYLGVLEAINATMEREFGEVVARMMHHDGDAGLGGLRHVELAVAGRGGRGPDDGDALKKWSWWALDFDTIAKRAGMVQFAGAILFLVSVLMPGDEDEEHQWSIAAIWDLQIVGSLCFLYAARTFYLELQNGACPPKLHLLEWHVQAWNVLGALGFLFCAAFGIHGNDRGMALTSFWGSVAFLVSSALMVEVADKHPNAADWCACACALSWFTLCLGLA